MSPKVKGGMWDDGGRPLVIPVEAQVPEVSGASADGREFATIGYQLRLMRQFRGLTLRALGESCGGIGELTEAAISRIETGERQPRLSTIEVLSVGLGCKFTIAHGITWIDELDPL